MRGSELFNDEARMFLSYLKDQNLAASTKNELFLSYSVYRAQVKPSTVACNLHQLLLALKHINAIDCWTVDHIEWKSGTLVQCSHRLSKGHFNGREKRGKQIYKPLEASGCGGTFEVSPSFKDSRRASKEKGFKNTEVEQVDPEEEIVWNGRASFSIQSPATSLHLDSSACREAGKGAGSSASGVCFSSQNRSEAKWVPLLARNGTVPHQYADLRNFLENTPSEVAGTPFEKNRRYPGFKTGRNGGLINAEPDALQKGVQKNGSRVNSRVNRRHAPRERVLPNVQNEKGGIPGGVKYQSGGSGCGVQVYRPAGKSLVQSHESKSVNAVVTGPMHTRGLQQRKALRSGGEEAKKHGTSGKNTFTLLMAGQDMEGEISVSQPFSSNEDQPQMIDVGRAEVMVVSVVNNGNKRLILGSVKILYAKPRDSFGLALTEAFTEVFSAAKSSNCTLLSGPYNLLPGASLSLQLVCVARVVGYHKAVLLLDFGRQKIVRYANLIAEDDVTRALAPSEPYSRVTLKKPKTFGKYVPGRPPPVPGFAKPLGKYPLPYDIETTLMEDHTLPVFLHGLSFKSYQEYFSSLIYAEELQWKADICAYDMQNVTMRLDKSGYLVLRVPGLLERRPSVIYRDMIFVSLHGLKEQYQGFVYNVQAEEVLLKFHASFHKNFIANQQYDVRFSYSRITIRRALHAINASKILAKNFLFPSDVPPATNSGRLHTFMPVNRALNEEQRQSVLEILRKVGGPPYLIYGPPGTGKTVTVVEAILQILKYKPDGKILACAPSNAAADVLLDRLRGYVQVMDLLRLNAYTRPLDDVAPELWPYSHSDGSFFCCPSLEKLLKYKVIVSTYLSAAILEAQDLKRGHFSHIFLDEAGQGMEPEALVAVANIKSPDTVVVLAGDHQQLGPVIRSPIAQKFGLGVSLLERLSTLPLYSRSQVRTNAFEFNRAVVTKLVRNYRSHPAILDLPSRLFYDGELIACAPQEICSSLCGWEELPDKNFPILFVGIEGRDEREGKSPSWFNAQEASKVIEIVAKLKECRRNRLSDNDIGIISPYSQQVKKIKAALALKNLNGIKTGSVEQFQGQEKRVIIISTVRSSREFVESDQLHQIGFLENPKRFNVAITRAKALLVIIGNPYVLSQDQHWGELLQYCLLHKSYVGCPPPTENTTDTNEFKKYMDDLLASQKLDADLPFEDNNAAAFETPWPDPTC